MTIRNSRLAIVPLLLAVVACNNGGAPTAPLTPGGTPYSNPVTPSGFVIGGIIALSEPIPRSEGPIQDAELLLDGKRVGRQTFSPGKSIVYFTLPEDYVQPGAHELSIRVVRQSTSPNKYTAVGSVVVVNTVSRTVQQFDMPRESVSLGTGDAISMRFTVLRE